MIMVKVLLRTMPRLCDGTNLQRHRGMQPLRTTWAPCLRMVEVLLRTMQEPSKWDGIAFTQRAHAVPLLLVRGSNGSR